MDCLSSTAVGCLRSRLSLCARVLLCALAVLAGSSDSWAQLPEIAEGSEPLEVRSLDLVGVDAVDEGRLRAALATESKSKLFFWRDGPAFDTTAFKEDLERIVAYHTELGYRGARIASYDVNVTSDRRGVDIVIRVDEGKPTLVSDLVFDGFEPVSADLDDLRDKGLPIAIGGQVAKQAVFATVQQLTALLKNQGYAYAKVDTTEEPAGPEAVSLRFTAQPGAQAYFGPIEITGHQSVSDDVIRRQLTYRPGELFQRDRLLESQRRLYGVELFEFANIEVLDEEKRPAAAATRVTVAEGKHRAFDISGGYGTEERVRGEATWRHVNFFGGARSFSIRGRASKLEQGGELTFTQPALFHPDLRFDANGHNWWVDEPAFQMISRGGGVALTGTLTKNSSWRAAFDGEFTSSSVSNAALADLTFRDELIALGLDPTTGSQQGQLNALTLSAQRNTSDNILDPRRGTFLGLTLENAGGLLLPGRYNYARWAAEGRGYLPIGSRAWLAGRARWTSVHPDRDPSDVPFFKRLFLGGASSLRGWGRFEVSPLSGSGLPIGGLSALESSGELRFLLTDRLIAVAFVDAGNVWANAGRLILSSLRYDAGPGLRYITPIGPVRFDLARQLNPIDGLLINGEPEQRFWRVHIGIGQSF